MKFRWPWSDPDPLPPPTGVDELERLRCEAEKRRSETLEVVRRRRRISAENHFADDVRKALGAG